MRWPWSKKHQLSRRPHLMDGQNGYVFRRSRTLTGTTSPNVTASAEKRGLLKTERLKLHELKLHRVQILRGFAVFLALAAVVAYFASTLITSPQLSTPQPASGQLHTAEYQTTIQTYLNEHPFERFGVFLQPSGLQAYMRTRHKELRDIGIGRAWYGGDVHVSLYFRQPLLVWRSGTHQFYVDDQGIAFSSNYFAEPAVVVTDQSGIDPDSSGGAVASSRFISFLGRMVGAVNGYGKGVVESVLLPASTREIDLKLKGRAYPIKTHIDRDPLEQAEDIANTLAYFDQKGIAPQYIDVRVAHKAFYK